MRIVHCLPVLGLALVSSNVTAEPRPAPTLRTMPTPTPTLRPMPTLTARPLPTPTPTPTSNAPPPPPAPRPQVGMGVWDITGPVAEVTMMGYASTDQSALGLQQRLWARAYAFSIPGGDRFLFISAELGQLFSSVKQGVVKKLASRYGALWDERNVMISATHTHAGPGGYAHHAIYNFSSFGFVRENYDAIVDGIYRAAVEAIDSVGTATMRIASGEVQQASVNRSVVAYQRNPDRLPADVNREMTVLRIDRGSTPAGAIAWFPVHNTSLTRTNRYVSSDHKGYASLRFEAARGTKRPYVNPRGFVAAFPNSEEGDVSPNIEPGFRGPGGDEWSAMRIIGDREFAAATSLFDGPGMPIVGPLDGRHTFVNMPGLLVATAQKNGAGTSTLCSGAYGFSFAAGAEDGPSGFPGVREGMLFTEKDAQGWTNVANGFRSSVMPDFLRAGFNLTNQTWNDTCQRPKPVLLPVGSLGWTPNILPFQILRIGTLAIAGVPAELTTQAGRRLKDKILSTLSRVGVSRVVITGLANEYSGYVTTPEEYDTQQYEGASTLFGRLTLDAYLQIFGDLAARMTTNTPVAPGPTPPDLGNNQASFQTGVVYDSVRVWERFGQVTKQPPGAVNRGATVEVTFRSGHPKNDLRRNSSYFWVERKNGALWDPIAWDASPETRMLWRRETSPECAACSWIDVRWDIPADAPTGTYRIRHQGKWKNGAAPANNNLVDYEGITQEFSVR